MPLFERARALAAERQAAQEEIVQDRTDANTAWRQGYTLDEVAEVISAKTGKTVKYKQLPEDVWKGFLPEVIREHMLAMMSWYRDYGYFGPEMKEHVDWTAGRARGKLTTFEEYLERCPMYLK
jgi:hypothetical protein